jgi:hypothetical protein
LALEVARTMSGHAAPETPDFSIAFLVVGLMTLAAAPIAVLMPSSAGDELTGRRAVASPPLPASPAATPVPRAGE